METICLVGVVASEKIERDFGGHTMDFMGTKLEDIIVTLPFEDGTTVEYGVYSYFKVNNKEYFAMLPLKGKKQLDFSYNYQLYEVQKDAEDNPIVLYIEDDEEYAIAADYFSKQLKK